MIEMMLTPSQAVERTIKIKANTKSKYQLCQLKSLHE